MKRSGPPPYIVPTDTISDLEISDDINLHIGRYCRKLWRWKEARGAAVGLEGEQPRWTVDDFALDHQSKSVMVCLCSPR